MVQVPGGHGPLGQSQASKSHRKGIENSLVAATAGPTKEDK